MFYSLWLCKGDGYHVQREVEWIRSEIGGRANHFRNGVEKSSGLSFGSLRCAMTACDVFCMYLSRRFMVNEFLTFQNRPIRFSNQAKFSRI